MLESHAVCVCVCVCVLPQAQAQEIRWERDQLQGPREDLSTIIDSAHKTKSVSYCVCVCVCVGSGQFS